MNILSRLRIVLINTSHPGNIGAAARAMKNMGIHQLTLVNPERFPSGEAVARASGATDVLDNAIIVENFEEALSGCTLVIGTSARLRTFAIPMLDARECAAIVVKAAKNADVALIFGREYAGLTNEELQQCHYHVQIPCNPQFSSLNLAQAVQILCYELLMASNTVTACIEEIEPLATADEMSLYYQHLEEVLIAIDFLDPAVPRQLMARMRRLYNRAKPNRTEINILRGILTAVQKKRLLS